jgi:hypothetical protein
LKPEEVKKLDAYLKRTLNPGISVKARPRKDDSAEVYLGEEFIGVIYRDDEDGDLSYNFQMAIQRPRSSGEVFCCVAAQS